MEMRHRHHFTAATQLNRMAIARGVYGPTKVATPTGWRCAASLTVGDCVLTVANGARPIRQIDTVFVEADHAPLWSMHLPARGFGAITALSLPPHQPLLIETDQALPFCGEPFALIPALALNGWRGAAPFMADAPEQPLVLRFDKPDMIYAGPGLILGCPGISDQPADWNRLTENPATAELSLSAGRHLVACLIAEDTGSGLRSALA